MKFCFVNSGPNEGLDERERRKAFASFPPLGILYLATVLEEKGFEVSVLDQAAKDLTVEQTTSWIEKENPDVLGFSTFASSGRTAVLVSSKVKEKDPNVTVVFGGYFATFNSQRVLRKYPSVDIVVRGEGEDTVCELADCFKDKRKLKRVRGITFRNKKSIVSTPERPLMKNLDSLPFPDRSLIDLEYHSMIAGANAAPRKFTSIVSSRGCVYRCRFCSCTQFALNRWRPRSVKNTLEELHFLASEGYKQFVFVDDSFTLNQKRVIDLCRRIKKEKINMDWICEGRVDNFSYEMSKEIVKAGCKILYFGIESGNQRILDYYDKQITLQQSKTAVKTAKKAGVDVIVGSFIVGAPDETKEEIQNTIEFAKQIQIDFPQFNILGAYPGSDIWNELQMNGLLKEEAYWETGVAISEICPTAVPLNECKKMIHEGFYDFVRRPRFIAKQIAKSLKSPYRMQVLVSNLSRIRDIIENTRHIA